VVVGNFYTQFGVDLGLELRVSSGEHGCDVVQGKYESTNLRLNPGNVAPVNPSA
jgi:hypothetical protein